MHAGMQAGDSVLTTSGFYGVIIDIMDDTVIVEFGNNRNCRIPMQKDAIAAVEKPNLTKQKKNKANKKKEVMFRLPFWHVFQIKSKNTVAFFE